MNNLPKKKEWRKNKKYLIKKRVSFKPRISISTEAYGTFNSQTNIIKQGDPGSILFLLETGEANCYITHVN